MSGRAAILILGSFGLLALGAPAPGAPHLVWNATASAPEGLYWLHPGGQAVVGDLVAVRPPEPLARWLAARGYAPRGALLIKRLAALPPSLVCRSARRLAIDGVKVAEVQGADRRGRPLPTWGGCRRLSVGEVLLLNPTPGSLDGRYFGPLARATIQGRVTPLWLISEAAHAR